MKVTYLGFSFCTSAKYRYRPREAAPRTTQEATIPNTVTASKECSK